VKTIIFDLDGTLAQSKQPIEPAMAVLLSQLLRSCAVVIISGGSYEQFKKQFVAYLPPESLFENLLLLPVTGTAVYRYISGSWKELYADTLSNPEKETIINALKKADHALGFDEEVTYGDKIEDRRTQITYSGLGQNAPVAVKKLWDPHQTKRKHIIELITPNLPHFDIHCGGMTSIDITRKGIDKASGIRTVQRITGAATSDIIFVGDALYPGGNDFPATTTGVTCITVQSLNDTMDVIKQIIKETNTPSRSQIVGTLGPASFHEEIFFKMVEKNLDVVRLNFSWGDYTEKASHIQVVRTAEKKFGKKIPIMIDLPGPRIQESRNHTYAKDTPSALTDKDRKHIQFGIQQNVDWIAVSFVGSAEDITNCRAIIKDFGGKQKIVAKIERSLAVRNIDEILATTDAIMIARGDLGNEIPLEKIPFTEAMIIEKCNAAGKPVITATQMMLSMTENPVPTRAEVTDVTAAILLGSDAVMLSEETASGKYPVEAVAMMEKILIEAEGHKKRYVVNTL